MKIEIVKKDRILKAIKTCCKRFLLVAVCNACLLFSAVAQPQPVVEYKGASDVLFATSDSRLVANVVEMGDSIKVEVLGIGYIHAGVLAFTLVYDTSKLTLVDKFFLNEIPFASSVHAAMELSPSLPSGYGIDVTKHAVIQEITNMAYYKGGLYTSSYNLNNCWKVQYGEVDKAFTLFLKKKQTNAAIQSSDLGMYLSYLPKNEPYWGIDVLQVGYKYGSGKKVHKNGIFMDYCNENLFAFRWASTITTDEATNIKQTAVRLNGSFERSKFNPAHDVVTAIDNPYFTPTAELPNTLLGWDKINRYGFIYSDMDADIVSVPFSKKIQVDGTEYEFTDSDLLTGSFTVGGKTFSILPRTNSTEDQTVFFSEELTNLEQETDYYAWAFQFYAFQTSTVYPAVGEKIEFRTVGCLEPPTPIGLSEQIVCTDATVADLQAVVDIRAQLKWYQNGVELLPEELLVDGETYYARAVNGVCISEDSLEVVVSFNHGSQISVDPLGAYMAVGGQTIVVVTDDNPTPAKSVSVVNPAIANAVLIGDTIVVYGNLAGNTEITYVSINEYGCESTYLIPVQVGVGNPTGILAGKDIVVCNTPGGGDMATVQIAYIMGGVSPWNVTVSDDKGLFSVDTLINSLNDLPVNVMIEIPENTGNVPEYTTYTITNIVDVMGNNKQTHYGSVRIGTNPTPRIANIANQTQTVCAGETTLPVSFDGIATLYHYSVDEQIGTMNYSSNGIPPFVAVNESANPITATVIITPEYWYNGLVCIGYPDTAYITVLPKVVADFTTSVQSIGQILFTDASVNAAAWYWEFGDGTTSSEQSPLHTFGISATYTITLTVTSNDGCTATTSKMLTVSTVTDLAANFHINETEQCATENNFVFTNQSTITIPNGHVISDYRWDFGDGNIDSVANPTHTYEDAGTYTVTLTVTESPTGTQSSISHTVSVLDLPEVTLQAPLAVCEGELLQIAMPEINWNGHTPVDGTWTLDGYSIDPANTHATATDNGKILTYTISTICGDVITSAGAITVDVLPQIDPILSVTYCSGEQVPEQALENTADVVYQWTQTGDAIGLSQMSGTGTIPDFTAVNHGAYPLTAIFEVVASNGNCQGDTVCFAITVNSSPILISQSDLGEICSGTTFSYTAGSNASNVTFNWTRAAIAGINNGAANSGTGAVIGEVLHNHTNDPIVVTYTIEIANDNCTTDTTITVTVNPIPNIIVEPIVDVCFGQPTAILGYTLSSMQQQSPVFYSITFDRDALAAGFINVSGDVLADNEITISLPNFLPTGTYGATLTVASSDSCFDETTHSFYIQVNESPRITQQPESVTLCSDEGFTLSVVATGKNLTYQWYQNGLAIPHATSSTYEVSHYHTLDSGVYYVEVSGDCGMETSQRVEVSGGGLKLLVKWTDVIFVSNADKQFVGYQWYKDGRPIGKDGNYQSYMEEGGLDGTYYVVVTYADGTKDVSCPLNVNKPATLKSVSISPNPVQPHGEIIISMNNYSSLEMENSRLEIINMLGQQITETTLISPVQKIQLNVNKGTYMYRITTKQGEVIVGKIWVH